MAINGHYRRISPERLQALLRAVEDEGARVGDFLFGPETWPEIWTERNWLGLHSLLSRSPWDREPLLAASLLGGREIGEDLAYGPARHLTAAEVSAIAAVLQRVTESGLRRDFDPDALNASGTPPVGGWRPGDFPYLWQTFAEVRDFFHGAAECGDALLLWLL